MKYINNIIKYSILSIASFLSIFPFYWMIVSGTNLSKDVIQGKMWFGKAFLYNLKALIELHDIHVIIFNTIKIAVISTIVALIFTSMAAYGFQMYYSKRREKLYAILLLSMMIPFATLMIPLYRIIIFLGLYDTHLAIIIPIVSNVFLIFFFRQNFKAMPISLVEMARIDGANELEIFIKIVVPIMKSTYAAAAIYTFMMSWNNYIWPLIVLQTESKSTLILMLSSLASAYNPDFGVISVGIIITTLPLLTIFFLMQKQFVAGMLGSVK